MNPRVLVVSRDAMLLYTRQLILGAFFEVQGADRIREVEALISTQSFDLVVVCYTLSASECLHVLDLIAVQKRRPLVLILKPAGGPPEEPMLDEAVVLTEAGPYYLLKKTAEMLGVDIQSKSKLVEA